MVSREAIKTLCDRIFEEFHPEKIVLFGSYAYGKPREHSDVDLLVILPFEGSPFRKSLEILNKVDPRFPIDLLARTPADTIRRYREGDPLIKEALDKGAVLYDQRH
jgi:predicted nucleotidyltransferase